MSPATATLAGTVQVSSPTGAYKFNSPYTILSAVGGLVGQFNAVTGTYVTGVVNNVGNDVLLTLSSNLRGSAGGGMNQQNVAAALDRGFNAAGNNAGFEALFLLPPGSLPNAMSQLSGEVATAVGPAGLEAMSQFLKLMLDPFAGTRGEAGGGPALGFAPERRVSKEAASAYAAYRSILKAPAPGIVRAALDHLGGGLRQHRATPAATAAIGSHDRDLRIGGVAAGADYRVSPNTVVGFALSGAGTNFGLSDGLGTGRGDILQGGVYGATRFDNYYLAASLAASYYDVSTERIVSLPGATSRLTASFGASGFGARIEGGRRFVVAKLGVTPFVAVQGQTVQTPAYTEQGVGAPFALAYSEQNDLAAAQRARHHVRFLCRARSGAAACRCTGGWRGRITTGATTRSTRCSRCCRARASPCLGRPRRRTRCCSRPAPSTGGAMGCRCAASSKPSWRIPPPPSRRARRSAPAGRRFAPPGQRAR